MKPLSAIPTSRLKRVRGVFTDVDDTITTHGRLTARALGAVEALVKAGIRVVPVTGGPAGWCDHIARAWNVDAVIGEGGAFYFHLDRETGKLRRRFWFDDQTRAEKRQMMEAARDSVLAEFPGVFLSSDQPYRELDLAIELRNAKGSRLPDPVIADIRAMVRRRGMTTKVSSIHINAYFGDYDKLAMARIAARELWDEDLDATRNRWLFIGDSANDEAMFSFFPLTVGVANVRQVLDRLPVPPKFVTPGEGGAGFAQAVRALIDARR
ncbi:MAG: HAD-IIB family hydrolase [Burkholderiales bacterium]|nr:HAD-IIB family hydrolase [Burkholderiales bacterium]